MSGNGAWYGGDEPTAEQPLVPQPVAAPPVVPQQRTAADDAPPMDLPPPFPASMYEEEPETPTATIPRIGTSELQLNAIELTTEPAPADPLPPPPVPEPRSRRDIGAGIAIAIVILMVLCIGAVGSSFQVLSQGSKTFETGNCVAPDTDARQPFRHVECTDPAATHTVVGVVDRDADRPCRSVPGASTLFSTNATVVCLGRKGVDASKTINTAREGDCVNVEGSTAVRADCRDPGARFQVIKRLTDVPEGTDGPCGGVEGVAQTYEWNWTSSDPVDSNDKSIDVVLCLGPSQAAMDAEAAARAAQSSCRFLTDAEVSASVSAATSKTYTVSKRVDDGTHCSYQFSKANEIVRVGFFSGAKLDPGNNETFTLDGLRAAWDPGRGDRSLGVEVPTGTIYIKVQLSGVGDSTSRKLAIETFKSARARIT